jgi:YfiH family protein
MSELKSRLLERIPWLYHGFGTRSGPLDQTGMASLKQIHSSLVLVADRGEGGIGEGDALLANEPGLTISVRTADCLPILLVDSIHKAVAAVHAGWRGTAGEIAGKTLRQMQLNYGTHPENILAAIGPGIGACCYEVGEEVARQFGQERAGRLDLALENVRQLERFGVPAEQMDCLSVCTFCNPGQFHSWRRDKNTSARMVSYVGILSAAP